MKSLLAGVSHAINRAAPGLKSLLPKSLHRFILLRVLGVNREYEWFADRPGRRFMERDLLPWLRDHMSRVLFVGTASYTYHYERLFRDRPDQFTTLDFNAGSAVWGASNHIVAPVQEIGRHRPEGSFDCAVLNGVFGFGVDDADAMRATVKAIHEVLVPGGLLVIGWNTDRHADPNGLDVFEPWFAPAKDLPWSARVTFEPEIHINDFYARRPDPDRGQA